MGCVCDCICLPTGGNHHQRFVLQSNGATLKNPDYRKLKSGCHACSTMTLRSPVMSMKQSSKNCHAVSIAVMQYLFNLLLLDMNLNFTSDCFRSLVDNKDPNSWKHHYIPEDYKFLAHAHQVLCEVLLLELYRNFFSANTFKCGAIV